MRKTVILAIGVICCLCLAACRSNPPIEIDMGPYCIDRFSSEILEDGTINFSWEYVSEEFDHLDIKVSSGDDSFSDSIKITDRSHNTYSFAGESGKVYSYSFCPYFSDGTKGKVYSGTRYIQPSGQESGLPRVIVTTVGSELPDLDYVLAPEGSFGAGITNNDYVYCSVVLLDAEGDAVNKSKNQTGDECRIKIRGNTSAYVSKKSYKLKLNKKEDMVGLLNGRTGDQYEDKEWLLLSSGTNLNNVIGFAATECLGIDYVPAYAYIELYINGEYQGIYMLVESIKEGNVDSEGNQARCNVSEDGFVIENDPYWWNEDLYFRTDSYHKEITFKYPDWEDVTDEQLAYIEAYMNSFELALKKGEDIYGLIDGRTFSAWVMVHEYLGCYDAAGSNQYMIKRDSTENTKLEMTTAWDFDGIMNSYDEGRSANMNRVDFFYSKDLLKREDFRALCNERYSETRDTIIGFIGSRIDALDSEAIDKARAFDAQRWCCDWETVESQKTAIDNWLTQRLVWMDTVYR